MKPKASTLISSRTGSAIPTDKKSTTGGKPKASTIISSRTGSAISGQQNKK
jgi:hypothetical protein